MNTNHDSAIASSTPVSSSVKDARTTPIRATVKPSSQPIPIPDRNRQARHELEGEIRNYTMDRFTAAHGYFDHALNEAIRVMGGDDELHSCAKATTDVKIKRLCQLMMEQGFVTETDHTYKLLVDEFGRVDKFLKRTHRAFYSGPDGAPVADLEDAIYRMRKVRRFPGYMPAHDRPYTTCDEAKHTGRYILHRVKDLYCEGDGGELTELVSSYFFPDSPCPTTACDQI